MAERQSFEIITETMEEAEPWLNAADLTDDAKQRLAERGFDATVNENEPHSINLQFVAGGVARALYERIPQDAPDRGDQIFEMFKRTVTDDDESFAEWSQNVVGETGQ